MISVKDGRPVKLTHVARRGSAVYHTLEAADRSPQGNRDKRTSLPELQSYRAALDARFQSGTGYDPKDSSTWWPEQFALHDDIKAVDSAIAIVERDGDKPPKPLRQRALELVTWPLAKLVGLLLRRPRSYWN